MAKPTLGEAVRSFCLECLGAERTSQAFDCQSRECPLYVCCPFRGREVPHNRNPEPSPEYETAPDAPTKRPSRKLVSAQCEQCLGIPNATCEETDCPLYPVSPWMKRKRLNRTGRKKLPKPLGINEYGETYMEPVIDGNGDVVGSLRTADNKLVRQVLEWRGTGAYTHTALVAKRQWICEEIRFPLALWDRVVESSGVSPTPQK